MAPTEKAQQELEQIERQVAEMESNGPTDATRREISKLQERIPEVTSWRQYSLGPAAAGVATATQASANNAAAGAAEIFKSCFILFSLCQPRTRHMGCCLCLRHRHRKKAKQFSAALRQRSKNAALRAD